MKKNVSLILSISFLLLIGLKSAWSQNGKISGYFIGDYYYVAQSHDEALKNRNGFQYRRIYFQYDKDLADEFAIRLRLEMNSSSFPEEKVKLEPFVKHGYLKWTKRDWRTNAYFGLSGTPTWEVIEKVWGYRSVAKTLLDMQKMGGSTDFGIAIQGAIDPGKKLNYHFMLGNGAGTSAEIDEDKKLYLSLTAKPADGITVEIYGDYENREESKDIYTVQGFAAYQQDKFRVGAQFVRQTRQQGPKKEDKNLEGFSLFGAAEVVEKRAWALARVDHLFDPSPGGAKIAYTPLDGKANPTMILVGLDWTPVKDMHIIPNLFLAFYETPEGKSKAPDTDIMPRLTLYYKF
ncbi:MAG: hypothetical protein ACE5PV_18930 [Candidatus Poribacteria bacterium]